MLLLALSCSSPPPAAPDPCRLLEVPAPGPLSAERAKANDPLAVARLHVEEARRTGDPGFYTLAESAVACAAARTPADPEPKRLRAHLEVQFHRFSAAESLARELTASPDATWTDHMLLCDALMEQGRLDPAADACQRAMDLRPGLPLYDRVGWLRWLWGDVDGAVEMQALAVSSGSPADPEPYAWVLTRLGWLHALRNEPAPEIEQALAILPDYPPARFARGRVRLAQGSTSAADDLQAPTFESARAWSEIGGPSPDRYKDQDPRGYATWLSDRDAKAAVPILDAELAVRQDAVTHIAHAYAVFRSGGDGTAEARAAIATGIPEPRSLLQAGLILGDRALVDRALAMGPGLLPSERALAR